MHIKVNLLDGWYKKETILILFIFYSDFQNGNARQLGQKCPREQVAKIQGSSVAEKFD